MKDLTQGKPEKVLWAFCLPLFGSVIFQQLYNIADSLVAGKFIDENALAAVGNSYEITLIFIAVAFGCNMGCSVIAAQNYGAKNLKDMKTGIYTALIVSGVLCALLMVGGILGCDWLIGIIHTPDDLIQDSRNYLMIYIWGLPFLFFYNIATGIFSALGDSKTPFIFLAISSFVNVIVDIVFVAVLQMGVPGVAWATFLCQGVSCIVSMIVVLVRLGAIKIHERTPIFSWSLLGKMTRIAVPSILQQGFISVGNIILQRVINGYGPGVMAGYSAAIKLNNLVITSFTTLANGISNFTAQNIGANQFDRIKDGFKAGLKMVWIICIPIVALYMLLGKTLITFFMKEPSQMAWTSGMRFLWIVVPFYFIISVKLTADGVLRGAGMMKFFMISTFTDLILRVGLAFVLSNIWGYTGIWCAWPIGWAVGMLLSVLFYNLGPWKGKKKTA